MTRVWGRIILLGLVALLAGPVRAIEFGFAQEDAGQPGAFLDFAASGRSLGMGRAGLAVTDDAGSVYQNAAGLARVKRSDVVALYAPLYQDSSFGYFSFAQPFARKGAWGAGLAILGSDGFDQRDQNGVDLGTTDLSELGFLLSYGRDFWEGWAWGATAKLIRQDVGSFAATGFGLDLGLQKKMSPTLSLGAGVKNFVAPTLTLESEKEEYPRILEAGLKWSPTSRFLMAFDLRQSQEKTVKALLGAEWKPTQVLALRAGLNESNVSVGLGFEMGDWALDYALAYNDPGVGVGALGETHRIGLRFKFGEERGSDEQTLKLRSEAQSTLAGLRTIVDSDTPLPPQDVIEILGQARQAIRLGGFVHSRDLVEAQGYVRYLEGDLEGSVYYLTEAISLSEESSPDLIDRRTRVLARLDIKQKENFVQDNFASALQSYEAGSYREAVQDLKKVLQVDPAHIEAKTYLEFAQDRLMEPINRALKIAKGKMEKGQYLEAIRHLNTVKTLEADHPEATALMENAIQNLEASQRGVQGPAADVKPADKVNLVKSRALFGEGLQYYSRGKLEEAKAAWREALRFNPNDTQIQNAYNRALIDLSKN